MRLPYTTFFLQRMLLFARFKSKTNFNFGTQAESSMNFLYHLICVMTLSVEDDDVITT